MTTQFQELIAKNQVRLSIRRKFINGFIQEFYQTNLGLIFVILDKPVLQGLSDRFIHSLVLHQGLKLCI